jgi:hypothetical protein
MKSFFLTIAILIISISGKAQKAYGAESFVMTQFKDGVTLEPKKINSAITLLLLEDAFYVLLASNNSIAGGIAKKTSRDSTVTIYESHQMEAASESKSASEKISIHVLKIKDKIKVNIYCPDFILLFETNDREYQ